MSGDRAAAAWRFGSLTALAAIIVAGTVRVAIEPRFLPKTDYTVEEADRERIGAALGSAAVPHEAFVRALTRRRILLIGEGHFVAEPIAYVTALLEELHRADRRRTVLLLELASGAQADLDRYLANGDEAALAAAFGRHRMLPYQKIVRWARLHHDQVRAVVAYDEDSGRVLLMRLLGTDTRNATMADAVLRAARAFPGDRVVAFGGRFHMMLAGRYRYDSDTRRPIGARLLAAGVRREELAAVWLYAGDPPADALWTRPGAIALEGAAGELPVALLETDPVAGVARLADAVDYAVYLGAGTRIEGR